MSNGEYVEGSWYFYAPNRGAAIFFTLAFLATSVVHAWQSMRYRCWRLTWLFPFCSLLFVAGFALRVYGSYHYDVLNPFIASICITYAAPPLLELQNYHILGRVLYYVPYLAPLHPGRVLTTFGFVSAIVESLNGWGASLTANQSLSDGEIQIGHRLIQASLLIQIVVIVCFLALAAVFHRKCVEHGIKTPQLMSPLVTLYISMLLIFIRTIYRVVEYFGISEIRYDDPSLDPGDFMPMIRYEWFFYVFEASLMLINSVVWNFRHPRRYLPESYKMYLARDGITEVEGSGYKDPRPFWQTVVDPFDIRGLLAGGSTQNSKFWETDHAENSALATQGGGLSK
ncbi:hypothetical protein B0I35DRAFT_476877 [Stachybotrys elegans]|uniref:Uncharacterized protein n=1 Tax=Stachybotrys elegans TaxID=80388 RepID=A0A8K0SZJ5_9HYPO|nr:hypothetical protein B0I35DRAFT_476877 [Stachybotrys elegans]